MPTYRYILQGCNEAMLAEVNKAALAGIPGIKSPIKRSEMGYYFMSVDSEANHEKILELVKDAFSPLLVTVAVIKEWTPSSFSDLS